MKHAPTTGARYITMSPKLKQESPLPGQSKLEELIKDISTPRHRAITLSRRVALSPCVIDAQIVQATAEAAHFYGYAAPADLIGCWQSYIQHPQDLRLARTLSVLRHFGYTDIPVDYVSRICQGGTGRFRSVMKHTSQIELAGETYWLTVLEEIQAPPLVERLNATTPLPMPTTEELQQYSGMMSVAEMTARIQRNYPLIRPLLNNLTPLLSHDKMAAMQPLPELRQPTPLEIARGASFHIADGTFLHRCRVCGITWISEQANPGRCPRQRGDTHGKKCGTRTWRSKRAIHTAKKQVEGL